MLLGIGTRVKFRTTPDSGIITDKLGDDMVMVQLDGIDMEIPAFEEDLIREEEFSQYADFQVLIKQKAAVAEKKAYDSTPLSKNAEIKPDFSNSGVHLAFQPKHKPNGEIEKLDILLLNDTIFDLVFNVDFVLFNDINWSKNGKLNSGCFEKLGDMPFDDINDSPAFDYIISPIYTEGVVESPSKTLKIKTKQFIKNFNFSKFLNQEVYNFTLFEASFDNKEANDDLKKYTQSLLANKKPLLSKSSNLIKIDPVANVNEYATFVREIDLHIELLHDNAQKLTNIEMVNLQLRHFETYLSKAVRLNIPKVYIIHGVGKGKLKEMIHARLKRHPDVEKYKNEYHERYGWGATEVVISR
jgi:Smr domain